MENFVITEHNGLRYLENTNLNVLRLRHGFCDKSLDFKKSLRQLNVRKFCQLFNVQELNLLEQCHSNKYISVKSDNSHVGEINSDAFIIEDRYSLKNIAYGVLSADCLPIILLSSHVLAIIHSGWRGLANGILIEVIDKMRQLAELNELCAVIGPAAGSDSYEVGEDVISLLGENAVFKPISADKYLLSLSETAHVILKNNFKKSLDFTASNICVIKDSSYFSYRRQGEDSGRNLTFVIL